MKQLSLLALLVATTFAVQAQNVDFGLKGGLNLATWSNNGNGAGYSNRAGFNAGLFGQVRLGPQFAIQPEVLYSSQGTKYTVGNTEHNLALNYVNIPVMLQALVGRGFYAEAGPQIGFLTSVTDKVNDVETGYFNSADFKKSDVALGVGLGYTGMAGVGLDARYNFGLTNINNAGSNNIKNNVLQIDLTYKFNHPYRRR